VRSGSKTMLTHDGGRLIVTVWPARAAPIAGPIRSRGLARRPFVGDDLVVAPAWDATESDRKTNGEES